MPRHASVIKGATSFKVVDGHGAVIGSYLNEHDARVARDEFDSHANIRERKK